MKTFIYKTNQYLLERFPTIWNTRLVWMLLTAVVIHILFFVFGFFTLSNPEILHERRITSIFFQNGTVFLSSIVSVLLVVAWLIYMFKNNAFKNFYPTTKTKLFGQFMSYILILFSCTTFYLSYNYGIKTYVAKTYPDTKIEKEIAIANDMAMFFSEDVSDYTIDKRRYPKPFYDLYCETTERFVENDKPKLQFLDEVFQFYTLYTKEVPIDESREYLYTEQANDSTSSGLVFSATKDSLRILYYKDSVVDMTPFVKTEKPSFYNASFTFFISRNDTLDVNHFEYNNYYNDYSDYSYDYSLKPDFNIRHQLRNQRNYELLERNDKAEIRTLMDTFLSFSNAYKIDHNLTADQWMDLVYHPDNFEVKHFIRTTPKPKYENPVVATSQQTQLEKFYLEHRSDFHYDNQSLKYTFENIEDIKESSPFLESIHFFMWFSFFLACIIFMFRITGLKPLLFSIVTVGLLFLLVTLLTALLLYLIQGNDDQAFYFIMYFTLILGIIILAIPIFFSDTIKKGVVAICVNISIIGFPLFIFLILGIITMHQKDICRADPDYYNKYYDCYTIMDVLGINWSFVLFSIGLIFILFYAKIIKRWRALPEG